MTDFQYGCRWPSCGCVMPCNPAARNEQVPEGHVKLPTNASEAEAMQKVGYAWLKQHAPERLTDSRAEAIREALAGIYIEDGSDPWDSGARHVRDTILAILDGESK